MGWVVDRENLSQERTKGDVTCIASYRGQIFSGDDQDSLGIFLGSDDGKLSLLNEDLYLEKQWIAHKDFSVNHLAVGEDENGTVWLYTCSLWGEIVQWWPAALELLYHNSAVAPGSNSNSFTSAGGRLDSTVKQLFWYKGFLYSGDDQGKLCKWTAGLMLEWVKDTYSDIWSLAVAAAESDQTKLKSFTASPVQSQVTVGSLTHRKVIGSDASLEIDYTVPGRSPLAVSSYLDILACQDPSDQTVLVYSLKHGCELQHRLTGHTDNVSSLAVSSSGHYLASGAWDGKVMVWDLRTGSRVGEVACADYINAVCWAPNQDVIYAGGKQGSIFKIHSV